MPTKKTRTPRIVVPAYLLKVYRHHAKHGVPAHLKRAYDFFYEHGGYSYDPKKETKAQGRRRMALSLAIAEHEATQRGWAVTWEPDPEPYDYDVEAADMPQEWLGAVLRDRRGKAIASLWGIGDPDHAFRRIVEAELALEAIGDAVK